MINFIVGLILGLIVGTCSGIAILALIIARKEVTAPADSVQLCIVSAEPAKIWAPGNLCRYDEHVYEIQRLDTDSQNQTVAVLCNDSCIEPKTVPIELLEALADDEIYE